jgi:hypothetical protein
MAMGVAEAAGAGPIERGDLFFLKPSLDSGRSVFDTRVAMKFATFHHQSLRNAQALRYRLLSMQLADMLRDRSTPPRR